MVKVKTADLLNHIEEYDDDLVIFSTNGIIEMGGDLFLFSTEESEEVNDGYKYVLELYLVNEVLNVWSTWRNSKVPTLEEKIIALNYYAKNDAYLPI